MKTLYLFGVGLLLLVSIQDADADAKVSCNSDYRKYQGCYGRNTYCCPHKSYSKRYYGTTFSTCCNSYMKKSSRRNCSNSIYANYFCTSSSSHCCPSKMFDQNMWLRGCCYSSTSSRVSCVAAQSYYSTCTGISSYCCPTSYNSLSYGATTFQKCCDRWEYHLSEPVVCSNYYEKYWCRSPTSGCCNSQTLISGDWNRACCVPQHKGNGGAIGGGVVGGIILVVILSVTIGVVCCRKKTTCSRGNAGTVMQGGTGWQPQPGPQQMAGAYPTQPGPVGYPQQGGVYAIGAQPGPGFPGYALGYAPPPAMSTSPPAAGFHPAVGAGVTGPPQTTNAEPPPSYDNLGFST